MASLTANFLAPRGRLDRHRGMAEQRWTPEDVEGYLQKFEVEKAVQEAVNSAIKAKAADPVLHVADYLERRGREHEARTNGDEPPRAAEP